MILLELFYVFFKIGLLTFGGGYAMVPMIKAEAVTRGWLTNEMLTNFLAVSESTPGSFAVNISTFVGNSQAGFLGAMVATLGVVMPSFIIIIIIFQFYKRFIKNRYVLGVMAGLRAVVVGLIIAVGIDLILGELLPSENTISYTTLILFGVLILIKYLPKIIFKRDLSPITFILISAFVGLITYGVIL